MITDDDIVNFTQGNCHELALALNAITGWPIYTFIDPDDGRGDLHAFVQCPRGTFVDVQGEKSQTLMFETWLGDGDCYSGYDIALLRNHDEFIEQQWGLWADVEDARATRRRAKVVAEHIHACYKEGRPWGDDTGDA